MTDPEQITTTSTSRSSTSQSATATAGSIAIVSLVALNPREEGLTILQTSTAPSSSSSIPFTTTTTTTTPIPPTTTTSVGSSCVMFELLANAIQNHDNNYNHFHVHGPPTNCAKKPFSPGWGPRLISRRVRRHQLHLHISLGDRIQRQEQYGLCTRC
jgi:hypothetical protein